LFGFVAVSFQLAGKKSPICRVGHKILAENQPLDRNQILHGVLFGSSYMFHVSSKSIKWFPRCERSKFIISKWLWSL